MPKLLYQGHGSFRLTADDGRVVFVDPFAGGGYELPADIILVTHGHGDHSKTDLCAQKPECRVITFKEALAGGKHNAFNVGGIRIQAVEAGNRKHDPKECVGYIIIVDCVKIYASGDTSKTEAMKGFAALKLDYALFCGDGLYNMDIAEAAECAALVGAKNNIVIHTDPDAVWLFDRAKAEAWAAPNKLIIGPGQEIELEASEATLKERVSALKSKLKRSERREDVLRLKMKRLRQILSTDDLSEIRHILLSFADEFAIAQDAAEERALERRILAEANKAAKNNPAKDETPPTIAEIDKLTENSTTVTEGADEKEILGKWVYHHDYGITKTISIPKHWVDEIRELTKAENKNNKHHEEYRRFIPYDDGEGTVDEEFLDVNNLIANEEDYNGEGGTIIAALVKREIRQRYIIAKTYYLKWHEEIKATLFEKFKNDSLANLYYEYHYNSSKNMKEVSRRLGVAPNTVKYRLKAATEIANTKRLRIIPPSKELQEWYYAELKKLRIYS